MLTIGDYPRISLAKATTIFLDYHDQVANGGDPAAEIQQQLAEDRAADTIESLAGEYLERWAKPRKKSWREDERILNKDIIPAWKGRKAKEITRRDVRLMLDNMLERGGALANKVHALLNKMFNFAVDRDVVPFNPMAGMPKPAKVVKRDRILSDDEIRTHWLGISALEGRTAKALLFELVTAQRRGEVAAMLWSEIEGEVWTIPAAKAKNGRAHTVPLTAQAWRILDSLPKSGDAVFDVEPDAVSRMMRRYLMRLGYNKYSPEWVRPHDLRRTAASQMTGAGISRLVVKKVLNHADSEVTGIYDRHSYDKEKRQALETWGRRLDVIISGELASKVIPLSRRGAS